jgi:phasin family protein
MADKPGQKTQNERGTFAKAPLAAKAADAQPPKPAEAKPAAEAPKPVSPPLAASTPAPVAPAPEPVVKTETAVAAALEAQAQPYDTAPPQPPVDALKDKIMATLNTDFTQPINEAIGDLQTRARVAYEKSTEVATEVTEFTKGNVEAIVESSKILASGAQSLGKTYAEEAKSAYETITADVKELAAVRTPAELFQLQGKIMRRNFDTFVSTTSRNSEAVLKLANDTIAPFTGRVTVAAEKFSKVA